MPGSEATKVAVLQEGYKQMVSDIIEIKAMQKEQSVKLDSIVTLLNSNFVQVHEYESYKGSMDKALVLAKDETEKKLELAKKSAFQKMVVSVVITTIITALVVFFFNQVTNK